MSNADLRGSVGPDFCPYRGLYPYTEEYRPFFFGREADIDIITANLLASRLSVLYGASGVGKSSVLLAGVQPLLRKTHGAVVLVFREWQRREFLHHLKLALLNEAGRVLDTGPDLTPECTLYELIKEIHRRTQMSVSLILDQFEEYFVYHQDGDEAFEAELARAVNNRTTDVHVMISLREEGLSSLDRFELRIPSILSNLLRLDHLDHESAEIAIRCPLVEYNRRRPVGLPRVTIDRALVDAILHDEVRFEQSFARVRPENGDGSGRPIEMPFLQLVLTKLWESERSSGSSRLRLATFTDQEGATGIVTQQLDSILFSLTLAEQEVAAKIFRHLVTPSGTKIAHSVGDLASNEDLPALIVRAVATKLAAEGAWILREVTLPTDEEGQERYEVFHDAVTPAVLAWRRRYVARQTEEARLREVRVAALKKQKKAYMLARIAGLIAILAMLMGALIYRADYVKAIADINVQRERRARVSAEQRYESLQTRFRADRFEHLQETISMSREIAGGREHTEELSKQLRTANSSINRLQERLANIDQERVRWQSAAQAFELAHDATRDTLRAAQQQITDLTGSAGGLRIRISELETQLTEANTRKTQAEGRATQAEERVTELEAKVQADTSIIRTLNRNLNEARAEVTRLNEMIRNLQTPPVRGDSIRPSRR